MVQSLSYSPEFSNEFHISSNNITRYFMLSSSSSLVQSSVSSADSLITEVSIHVKKITLDAKDQKDIALLITAKENLKQAIYTHLKSIQTEAELNKLHTILTAKDDNGKLTSKVAQVLNAHTGWGLKIGSITNASSYDAVLEEIQKLIKQKKEDLSFNSLFTIFDSAFMAATPGRQGSNASGDNLAESFSIERRKSS